MLTMTK